MKKQLWQVVGFLAALLATSTAVGQTNRVTPTDIPFTFTVANRTLPPGRYTVTRMGETVLRIFNSRNQGTVVLTTKVQGKAPEKYGQDESFTATATSTFSLRCGSLPAGLAAKFRVSIRRRN